MTSKIEWTEETWNPVVGCTKVSPGCKHCYAEVMAKRLQAMGAPGYDDGFQLTLVPSRLEQPLKKKRSTMYFVNSMSDLFHDDVPDSYIEQVMATIKRTPQHKYQILTKRAERLNAFFKDRAITPNIWLGVSVEDQKYGVPRIDHLRDIQASIRFLSVEPLLEDLGEIDLTGIHWVIVGGESGPRARHMEGDWALGVKRQCEAGNIPFFFKQWGTWGEDNKRRSKKANGRLLEGRIYDAMPA